jgi:hypothetical protein
MTRARYTDEQLIQRGVELRAEAGRSILAREFTRATGVSDATVRARFGSWDAFAARFQTGGQEMTPEQTAEATDLERLKAKGQAKRGELRAVIRDLERRLGEEETKVEHLLGLADAAAGPAPEPIEPIVSRSGKLPEATYVMLASDWHVGERVRPGTVGGRNEYNPDIAAERAERFWRSNLLLLDGARKLWDVNQALLWLGGDIITGYIHEEYEEENFLSPIEETMLAFDLIVRGLNHVLKTSDLAKIRVATSVGNHGRTTKKMRHATRTRNSYEQMLYRQLARAFAEEPRISWQIGDGYHNVVDIYGFRIRFHHGDEVKYGGGVGGLTVPMYRRMGRQAQAGERIDLDCIGHFHQLQFPKRVVGNGSLIGWTPFAENLGFEYEHPAQASFVIDAKHRTPSAMNPVFVTNRGGR